MFTLDFDDNLDDLNEHMDGIVDSFEQSGDSFIDESKDIVQEHIKSRCDSESNPDGSAWPENQPEYKARKGGLPVGILTGDMLARESLRPNVTTDGDTLHYHYAGGPFEQQKLGWFEDSGRIVWAWDDDLKQKLKYAKAEHMGKVIHGGSDE
jgi:hypothetical protein